MKVKIKKLWLKQIPVTKKRLKEFLLPKEGLVTEIVRICNIFDAWKADKTQPTGCLYIANTVRTNLHKIPFSEVRHRILTSLSGTTFELTKKGRFKCRRNEKLWRESIERAEYIISKL